MGWLFGNEQDKKEFVTGLLNGFTEGIEVIDHRVVGNHLWVLIEVEDKRIIFLALMAKENPHGWGYKSLDESVGPYHYDCPLTLLNKAGPPPNEYAKKWREKVRAYHAQKKQVSKREYVRGMVVEYGGTEYMLLWQAGPRRGWIAGRRSDGKHFRLPASYLSKSVIKEGEHA